MKSWKCCISTVESIAELNDDWDLRPSISSIDRISWRIPAQANTIIVGDEFYKVIEWFPILHIQYLLEANDPFLRELLMPPSIRTTFLHTNDTKVITITLAKGFNTSGYINIEKQFRPLMAQLFMNKPPYPQY